jgi:predicted phage terminase large subunit-like protein
MSDPALPTPVEIGPQPGPQEAFSSCLADICIYGGSAGGGKTWSLAFEAARFVDVPGYGAVIFRRTSPELQGSGSVWEEASKIYPLMGGRSREAPVLSYRFPQRSLIEFRHMQYEKDVRQHQSKQYGFVGFDELTHFEPSMFWYMLSRLRGVGGVPKRMRGTCNPDPDSFVRMLIDWWIGPDGLAIDARSGVIRWFVRLDEDLIWGDSPAAVHARDPHRIRRRGEPMNGPDDKRPEPQSFTFIRSRATDNRKLMETDPGYVSRLSLLPGAQAKRLRDGDWDARDAAGDYFDRHWCREVEGIAEKNVKARVRFWDKAATTPSSENPDPAWTRGVLVAFLDTGQYVVEDMQSLRAGPAEVQKLQRETAQRDGIKVIQGCWQDPGQAGVVDMEQMLTETFKGFSFQPIVAREDKTVYASVWSPLAKAGKLAFVRREYLPALYAECEGFPLRKHKDIMDALSGAFQVLLGGNLSYSYESADDRHAIHKQRNTWDDDDEDDEDEDDEGGSRGGRGEFF